MRRAAGVVVLALACALAVPIATARPVAAAGPTLTLSPASGGPLTPISFTYTWDQPDCNVPTTDSLTIILLWDSPDPSEQVGSGAADATTCSGTGSGSVPNDTTRGNAHSPTAYILDNTTGSRVANSGVAASSTFFVPPAPTPTPTPTPRRTPTPTPRPTPTRAVTPPPTPTVTAKPTPTPTPLPTPTPFVIGGGGGGSGGGSPQGGAACSAGIGRSPTPSELEADTTQLAAAGADPTSFEISLLASPEYFNDAGRSNLGFVTRLYDDVLRHDPTPVEVATSLAILSSSGAAGRNQLVQNVVLSREARAIRIDQAFHALLKIYPNSTDLALWVNRLSGVGSPGLSGNTMVEEIAASPTYYALAGHTGTGFVTNLNQDLLNAPPTPDELTADAAVIKQITAGSAAARLSVAQQLVSSAQFRADEITSYFANYMHPTCKELLAQECRGTIGAPSAAELSAALASLTSGSTEEDIIAGVLGSDQYYQDHASTQVSLVSGVYRDLLGRAPTAAELSSALATYTNDPVGHLDFAQAMVRSLDYQNLLVSLDYQQLLLRAPLLSEADAGQGILGGDVKSLQTPDEILIESIASTPEFYADGGGTDSRFLVNAIATLLMRPGTEAEKLAFLKLPPPHDAVWQGAVAESLVDSTEYRTDFIQGVYAKFLSFSVCAVVTSSPNNDSGGGLFKSVPGGWFGLGILVGVLIMGAGAAAFFTVERRRFARIYPEEVPRHHE